MTRERPARKPKTAAVNAVAAGNPWPVAADAKWRAVPPRLSTLLRALHWSAYLHLLGRTKRPEEREVCLRMIAAGHRRPVRELRVDILALEKEAEGLLGEIFGGAKP
jgi:hypothetical protein